MHATTCKVAFHLNGLIITLFSMHTVYNLRHIITITFGFVFQYVYIENIMPSLLWVPDGLRELFDSPSVRIDTKQVVCALFSEPIPKTAQLVFAIRPDYSLSSRKSRWQGWCCLLRVFCWHRLRHAEEIKENFRKHLLYKYLKVKNNGFKESSCFIDNFTFSCHILSRHVWSFVIWSLPHHRTPAPRTVRCGTSTWCGSQGQPWLLLSKYIFIGSKFPQQPRT